MKKSLFICTPAYNFQCYTNYLITILKLDRLCRQKEIDIYYFFRNDSLITIARNMMANIFLESNCTHLIFIDSDMEIDAEYIIELIEQDKPIIGLICAKKNINWKNITEKIIEYKKENKILDINTIKSFGRELNITLNTNININDKTIKVNNIGTGVMAIKRETLEEIKNKSKLDNYYIFENKKYFKFFDSTIKDGNYLSEDYWFCQSWKELGGEIYALNNICCSHHGVYKYD